MAYEQYPSAWKAKASSAIFFAENELPTAESSYALCKVSMYNLDAWRNLFPQFRVFVDLIVRITQLVPFSIVIII